MRTYQNKMNTNSPVMVSIKCLTYNHAPYIRQCLDGFIMQNTDFRYEAVVHDDASTDGTNIILREFAGKYPDIIIPQFEDTNQHTNPTKGGITKNMNPIIRGKYVAFCDGDDYWTDPMKLQKQVDYLEAHPECGMVYTQAKQYFQETGEFIDGWAAQSDFEDLLQNANKIMTLTAVCRSELYVQYWENIGFQNKFKMSDFPKWLYISKHSKIHFMDDVTGVYRILKNSASHNSDVYKKADFLVSTYHVRCYFAKKYGREELLDVLASNEADNLLRLSVQKDKNISPFILRFAKERGVVTWRLIIKCIMYSTRLGRSYHRRKYFVR